MMYRLMILFVVLPCVLFAQEKADFLRIGDGFMKKEYFIGAKEVTKADFVTAISSDGAAYLKYKSGMNLKGFGDVTSAVGVGMWIGGSFAAIGADEETQGALLGLSAGGLGLTVVGTLMRNAGKRKKERAVSLFNINVSSDRVGMVLNF